MKDSDEDIVKWRAKLAKMNNISAEKWWEKYHISKHNNMNSNK